MKNGTEYILRQGWVRGILSALIGSLVFALANVVAIIIYTHALETWALGVLLIVLAISVLLSILPGFYGGKWLAHLLYQDALSGSLTRKRATMKGILLGTLAGSCICIFVLFLYTRGDLNILIFRIISAIVIAGWMGGWAGAKLADDIAAYRPSN
jgi:hypothetical protein